MKEMSFEETKQVELEILKHFAAFCDANGLRYFLAYGTLIGAVRHKGFIPWDDDIDVWMPRPDYNRLLEIFNSQNGRYRVVNPYEKISRHTFAKIIDTQTVKIEQMIDYSNGYIGIDVFPLDGEPSDELEFSKWYVKLQKQYKRHSFFVIENKGGLKRKFLLPILKFVLRNKDIYLRKANKLHLKFPYQKCEYIGAVESVYNFKSNRYKREWFDESTEIDFEDTKFKVPVGYHKILTQMYGDYMKLPPKEKQVTHHSNNTFWLEGANEKI